MATRVPTASLKRRGLHLHTALTLTRSPYFIRKKAFQHFVGTRKTWILRPNITRPIAQDLHRSCASVARARHRRDTGQLLRAIYQKTYTMQATAYDTQASVETALRAGRGNWFIGGEGSFTVHRQPYEAYRC